jgi:hypothetical protein
LLDSDGDLAGDEEDLEKDPFVGEKMKIWRERRLLVSKMMDPYASWKVINSKTCSL